MTMRIRTIAGAALCATAFALIPAGAATAADGPIGFDPIDGTPYSTATADW
ncbi:MAG: hypothetical protein K0S05_2239, partial [Agromyces sp.]|nr:hypothetical protein [Agromyces sp.]